MQVSFSAQMKICAAPIFSYDVTRWRFIGRKPTFSPARPRSPGDKWPLVAIAKRWQLVAAPGLCLACSNQRCNLSGCETVGRSPVGRGWAIRSGFRLVGSDRKWR